MPFEKNSRAPNDLGKSPQVFANYFLSVFLAFHLNFQKGQWPISAFTSGHTSPEWFGGMSEL
jgi:hypothetical protein